jgi:flagellar basal-body rod protein FlgC
VDGGGQGVRADFVQKDPPFVPAYDPDSPFANADGIIGVPNVNLAEEAVNVSLAKTAYKANLATIKTVDEMQDDLLRILDKRA